MVSMRTQVALLQGVFIFMAGAARMKMNELATSLTKSPADQLQEIFQKKENMICGGREVHSELTKGTTVGAMRATNYDRVIKIAEQFLEDKALEIPLLTAEVKRLKEALAKAVESEAFEDAEQSDLVPLVMAAISKPDTFMTEETARKSQCGFGLAPTNRGISAENRKRRREARKQGTKAVLLAPLDLKCWENTVDAFDEELAGYLSSGKIRATSNAVLGACCGIVGCDPGVDELKSYCDELCTRLAGNPALNEVEFLGGSTKDLREELESKTAKLKGAVDEQAECTSAKKTLEQFRSQMDALNKEIEAAFDAQRRANAAVNEADDGLEDLKWTLEDIVAEREAAEKELAGKEAIRAGLAADLDKLKAEEPKIKEDLAAAHQALAEAAKLANEATTALATFNKLKVLVESTVEKMWVYFSDAVLTPLNNLGLQKGMPLEDFFFKDYEHQGDYEGLVMEMKGLDKFCVKSAKPKFGRVKKEDLRATLLDMCGYTPVAQASTEFASTVVTIGEKMLAHLETVQAWHEPLSGHPELTDEKLSQLVDDGEPAGLRNIENAFGPSSYFSDYLEKWKADGEFLQLLASLASLLEQLKQNQAKLEQIKDDVATRLKDHVALKTKTLAELAVAVKNKEEAEKGVKEKKGEEKATEELISKAEANLEELMRLLDEAQAAYLAALKLFEDVHKKGTNKKL